VRTGLLLLCAWSEIARARGRARANDEVNHFSGTKVCFRLSFPFLTGGKSWASKGEEKERNCEIGFVCVGAGASGL
jgi:hypothetical protein